MDKGDKAGVATIAEHQIEMRKNLPAKEHTGANDVQPKRETRSEYPNCSSLVVFFWHNNCERGHKAVWTDLAKYRLEGFPNHFFSDSMGSRLLEDRPC